MRAYSARYRASKYAERIPNAEGRMVHPNPGRAGHGSISAYTSFGCRCRACSDKMATYQDRHPKPDRPSQRRTRTAPPPREYVPTNKEPRQPIEESAEPVKIDLGAVFSPSLFRTAGR